MDAAARSARQLPPRTTLVKGTAASSDTSNLADEGCTARPHLWSPLPMPGVHAVGPGPSAKGSDKVFTCYLVNDASCLPTALLCWPGPLLPGPYPSLPRERRVSPSMCLPPTASKGGCDHLCGMVGHAVSGVVTTTWVLGCLQTLTC